MLRRCPLFAGCGREELGGILACLGAWARRWPKGAVVFGAGEAAPALGVVLEGAVRMEENDVWGARHIVGMAGPGQVFAEAYACLPGQPMLVDVVAAQPARLLFVDAAKLLRPGPGGCGHHARLAANLAAVLAGKNLQLAQKARLLTPRTIRERLLSYLSAEAARQGGPELCLPFDRQQLADYLSVDRSALSAELGKLRREGLLTCRKNRFTLHGAQPPAAPRG